MALFDTHSQWIFLQVFCQLLNMCVMTTFLNLMYLTEYSATKETTTEAN